MLNISIEKFLLISAETFSLSLASPQAVFVCRQRSTLTFCVVVAASVCGFHGKLSFSFLLSMLLGTLLGQWRGQQSENINRRNLLAV
jgi:hypothetical protein